MKTIVFGDIHGRTEWKKVVGKYGIEDVRYIFLGDYVDTHDDISVDDQYSNFLEILDFKKSNPGNVFLLIGNHDMHYYNAWYRCSNFSADMYKKINKIMKDSVDSGIIEIGIVDFDARMIFTHAGISKTWLKFKYGVETICETVVSKIRIQDLGFSIHGDSITGDDKIQGPVWIRPMSLMSDCLDGFTQFVGHTRTSNEKVFHFSKPCAEIYLCDSMPNQFVTIDESGHVDVEDVV